MLNSKNCTKECKIQINEIKKFEKDLEKELKDPNKYTELFGDLQLVLFHTEGQYKDDWVPMTHINRTSNCKWNGQKHHRDDHLMTEYGTNVIVLERDKKNLPYRYGGKFKKIELLENSLVKGIPKKYILIEHDIISPYNNIHPGDILYKIEEIDGLGCIMKSALKHLGLERYQGNPLGGIQLCRVL